jgi:hypothetical protein
MVDQEFEEGKQVEDYVAELDALKIEEEPNPESEQRLETIVSPPIRNEKKKTLPKREEAAVPVPQRVVERPVEVEPEVVPEIIVEQPKRREPVQQQAPEPQPQKFNGFDDYIERTAEAVKQNWRENVYRTLVGVVSGQLQIVPVQQPQEPEPQSAPQQQPQRSQQLTKEDLREIVREELPKLIPQAQAQVQPESQVVPPPINPKVVKQGKRWSLKAVLALMGVFVAFGMAIFITLNAVLHIV